MSVTSNGSRGEPQFASSGNTPTFAADLTAVSNFAATIAFRLSGTTAQRNSAAATGWVGLEWYDTDLSRLYQWRAGGTWKAWESEWVTYSPTLSGFVIGTGGSATSTVQYRYINGEIEIRYSFIFGTSGTTFPTNPGFTLPVNAVVPAAQWKAHLGNSNILDASAGLPTVTFVSYNQTSVSSVRIWYGNYTALTTTAPFTWAAGDALLGEFRYTPA